MADTTEPETVSLYTILGGESTLRRLVDSFYKKVQGNPLLSSIFPEDIRPVREKQFLFLTQLFGGPRSYSDLYGPPMLRARHLPFPITTERATAWLECMSDALAEIGVEDAMHAFVVDRLTSVAHHMVNTTVELALDLPITD